MASITITWHTHMDDRACPVCRELNNYQWVFDSSQGDVMTDALWHPKYGIVWSLSEGSNAHARGYLSGNHFNCRCNITHKIEAEDILAKCVYLAELIKMYSAETEVADTKTGSRRSTTFEDIGVDPSKYGL